MEISQNILQELVKGILTVMQKHLVRIVLYGSVARGTNTEESDIDAEKFSKWETIVPFYQNVVREGVVLWQTA